jgi:hypothetical protein
MFYFHRAGAGTLAAEAPPKPSARKAGLGKGEAQFRGMAFETHVQDVARLAGLTNVRAIRSVPTRATFIFAGDQRLL